MKRAYLITKMILLVVACVLMPFRTAYSKEGYNELVDAAKTVNEYYMSFGMYDSKVLHDLCVTKGTEYYDYIYWQYEDEKTPFTNYQVYATKPNMEALEFSVDTNVYKGKVYCFIGIMGSSVKDMAFPMIIVGGEGNFDKRVSRIKIFAKETYEINYKKGSELNVVGNGAFAAFCPNIGSFGMDIIGQLAVNKMNLSIEIVFSNNQKIVVEHGSTTTDEINPFYWFNRALTESNYIDKDGKVQMHFEELIAEMNKLDGSPEIKCTSLGNVSNAIRIPYGLRIVKGGEVGLESRNPWIKIKVENTTDNKTVDGFDVVFYGKTVYGDVIELPHNQGYLQYKTIIKDIKPKQKFLTTKIFVLGYADIKTIAAAIRKIHFSDGSVYEVPLRDLVFKEFDITY